MADYQIKVMAKGNSEVTKGNLQTLQVEDSLGAVREKMVIVAVLVLEVVAALDGPLMFLQVQQREAQEDTPARRFRKFSISPKQILLCYILIILEMFPETFIIQTTARVAPGNGVMVD